MKSNRIIILINKPISKVFKFTVTNLLVKSSNLQLLHRTQRFRLME